MNRKHRWLAAPVTGLLAAGGLVLAATPALAATCTVVNPNNNNCGPYSVPQEFTSSSGYNTYVGPDVFNPVAGESWNMTVVDPGTNWNITANIPNGDTAVSMYPSVGQQFPDPQNTQQGTPLSKFASLTSSFAENMNANSGTDGEAAYDLWFDNSGAHNELMIQFDNHGAQANCANAGLKVDSATFTDAQHGAQSWDFCLYGTEMIWQLPGIGVENHGSPDILAMMRWTQNHGYIASTSLFSLMGFGAEFCSTGGQNENFSVSQINAIATYGTVQPQAPAVTTNAASGVSSSAATLNGTVNPEGQATTYQFQYGPTTAYGTNVPSPAGSVGSGTSAVNESQAVAGLAANTTYHYRLSATNATGTINGSDQTFTTSASGGGGSLLVGDSTTEATADSSPQGQAEAFSYVAAATGTSATIHFYVDSSSNATTGKLGAYTDSGYNSPGTLLGQASFTPQQGWNTVTLTGVHFTAGTEYWLAELGTSGLLALRDQGSGTKDEESAQTNLTTLPSSWTDGPAWDTGHASFYISS